MLALLLFLALPGHPLSFVGGLPWGPLALGCAVVLGLGVFAAWPLPAGRWVAPIFLAALVLAAVKLALALSAPRYGLEASYYANDRFANDVEGSTVHRGAPYTRIDTLLEFGSDEFPLYFFNDSERFNTLGPDRLDRGKTLTWSAHWTGFLNVPDQRDVTIWLTASGPGELSLDGRRLRRVDAEGRETAEARVQLAPGPHALEVRYARKKERSGYLRVDTDLSGRRAPLEVPLITASPYPPERLALDRFATTAARALDAAYLVLLVGALGVATARAARSTNRPWPIGLERPLLALIPFGIFLQGALPRLDRYGKMAFLGGGQDWLTHETLARDVQFNGPLMTLGKPLGQGALYYAQPLYPYYLALLHTIAGEDLFGVTALQVLGLGVAAVLVYYLARSLFGRPTGIVALALVVGVLIPFELAWVARLLISEALYYWVMPAAVLAVLALVTARPGPLAAARSPSERRADLNPGVRRSGTFGEWNVPSRRLAIAAGLLLGLACLTRGPTLLYLPPGGLLLWADLRRRGLSRPQAARTLTLVGLSAALLIGLVPLRNTIVAGKPALTASSGGVNLEKFHRPPEHVRLGGVDEDPLYNALGLDRPTREVLEYVRQDPLSYFASYLPLAAYTLGIGSAMNDLLDEQPVQLQPELLVLNALYLLALLIVRRTRTLEASLLHAFIAVHFLTMVVFAPYDYENRLVTPMYLFVAVFAAAALAGCWELCVRSGRSHFNGRRPAMDAPPRMAAATRLGGTSVPPNARGSSGDAVG